MAAVAVAPAVARIGGEDVNQEERIEIREEETTVVMVETTERLL